MPTSRNSPQVLKKKPPAKRPSTVVQSKRLVTTAKADPSDFIRLLKQEYPDAHCELDHRNAFELLIATILSAQCTDVRVNIVTKVLFKEYSTPKKLATAVPAEIEEIIRSTGFFKNKTKSIIGCAQALVGQHKSRVPESIEALIALPGVGRKTANVVLGNAFGISSGIVVDTHVIRLSNRFGWTKSQAAEVIEKELLKKVPQQDWIIFSHLLITHGRKICKARNPSCESCFLFDPCPRLGL